MKLTIQQDLYAEDPLTEWDNPFRFISNHKDYYTSRRNVTNAHGDSVYDKDGEPIGIDDLDAMGKFFEVERYVVVPVRAYMHGGISLSTGYGYPYNDVWDSGTFGWLYASPEDIRNNFNAKRASKKMRETFTQMMKSFVETWDDYFTGNVFWFSIEDDNGEIKDSCGGFYGDVEKSGIEHHVSEEAYEALLCNDRKDIGGSEGWGFYIEYQSPEERNEADALLEAIIGTTSAIVI